MEDLNKMIMDSDIEYKDSVSQEAIDLMHRMLEKDPTQRLTAEEVLEHIWLEEIDDTIFILDEQELDLIRKEFTYISHKAKLKELKNRQADELNTEFTEHSINSNEDLLMKNDSSKSIILCPFNSQAGPQTRPL